MAMCYEIAPVGAYMRFGSDNFLAQPKHLRDFL